MVSIEDRLRELGYSFRQNGIPQRPNRVNAGQSLLQAIPGEWYYNKHGGVYVVNKTFIQKDLGNLSDNNERLAVFQNYIGFAGGSLSRENLLFLDIETTGLSSDVGTYVFLVGLGKYTSDGFEFTQFFLNSPAGELAMLEQLEKYISGTDVVVSYNGKSFDVPHIHSRYKFHSWPSPLSEHHHIDLLHLARKIWKARLPNRSLGSIEAKILGIQRSEEDVPGWMVAQLYLEYLHSQDAKPLSRIFYHNEIDVLSLAHLLNHVGVILSDPLECDIHFGLDLVSIGKMYADLGDPEFAVQIYRRGLEFDDIPGTEYQRAIKELAFIHKRQGNFEEANELWRLLSDHGDLDACIELAKYYEHTARSIPDAIEWTQLAMSHLLSDQFMAFERSILQPDIDHRYQRLQRKLDGSKSNAK